MNELVPVDALIKATTFYAAIPQMILAETRKRQRKLTRSQLAAAKRGFPYAVRRPLRVVAAIDIAEENAEFLSLD